jgi:hypothetical protein
MKKRHTLKQDFRSPIISLPRRSFFASQGEKRSTKKIKYHIVMTDFNPLDQWIAPHIRSAIEQQYYARINAQAQLQQALKDPLFLQNPSAHVALFADHGVVHVRDVAQQILQVLDAIHGVLIPARAAERFAWMRSYGVLVAYAHDIGMIDLSLFGRAMHPEYATQAVLSAEFDAIIDGLWADDRGQVAARLTELADLGALEQPPEMVLRELLAMVNCHSKSKVPVGLLNDPAQLRQMMLLVVATDLNYLYCQQRLRKAQQAAHSAAEADSLAAGLREAEAELEQAARAGRASALLSERLPGLYADFERDAFRWLASSHVAVRQLVEDVVDTLRALRCADALRQRGTMLKTSGNYEVFVDQRTSNAIYALRLDEEHLYLLEIPDRISAGEANIASSELDQQGNLRISFHHGMFSDQATILNAAYSAALVVNDIQTDVIESLQRPADTAQTALRSPADIHILIESVDDNPAFANLLCQQLDILNPAAARQARIVASLQASSALERMRYLRSVDLNWDLACRQEMLRKIEQYGHKTERIDPIEGFKEVRQIELRAGETLIESGAPSGFVYIPLGEGLRILPLGGYQAFAIQPWMPVGVTGVIRGSVRNAGVVAEQDLALLAIPKDVFLKHWHHTYTPQEFAQLFADYVL